MAGRSPVTLNRIILNRYYFFRWFELKAYTLTHFASPFLVTGIFKTGSRKLFVQTGFELQFS
jgi:hypothetical protein